MSYLHGKFVWFEHTSSDLPKARSFYEAWFGWHTEAVPMGTQRYFMIYNGDDGIGGYCEANPGETNHWVGYLSVADVDATHAAALAAGARTLMAPGDFGGVGRGSALADPTGAPFALWKGSRGDRPDLAKTPAGDWGWNELWTSDERKALAFYEKVFGYERGQMEAGEGQPPYYVLKKDGIPRAGLARSVDPAAPSMWLPYVVVQDCGASAAKATSLGGQVVTGPVDYEGIGQYAVVIDPTGAAIAIIRPLES